MDDIVSQKLSRYEALLFKWQKSINLISSNQKDFFNRHIIDSLQLLKFLGSNVSNQSCSLVDLGSGAGLPGIPLAISAQIKTYLIESDRRKSIFLTEVIRELSINVEVINARIEAAKITLDNSNIVITARALAELDKLLGLVQSFLENNNITRYKLILLKGVKVLEEIEKAQQKWVFDYSLEKSETDSAACVLIIKSFRLKN